MFLNWVDCYAFEKRVDFGIFEADISSRDPSHFISIPNNNEEWKKKINNHAASEQSLYSVDVTFYFEK